jgi:hemoglobin/transferrin/lactoferrin receptor protein
MPPNLCLFFFALLLSGSLLPCWAQQVQVLDKDSRQPIPGVSILLAATTRGIVTDQEGKADLSLLPAAEMLHFRHPAYLSRELPLEAIRDMGYLVMLEENIIHIPTVVISASRWEQKQGELPHDIVAISARDIALQNPQTTADMLEQSGEIFVQRSQQGGGSPMLRGFAANSVLLVVDGVRMNNAIYRSGNLQNIINLDPNILEGAEVIFGPGSVMYGSDALGGVMDFHTKSPLLQTGKGIRLEGSAMARYASVNREKTGHADVSLGGKKIASLSSISWSEFGDLRSGRRGLEDYPDYFMRSEWVALTASGDEVRTNPEPQLQLGSGYRQLNLLQKIRFAPSQHTDYLYSFHYSTSSDIPRYDRLTQRSSNGGRSGPLRFAEWYYGPQNWMLHSLQANYHQKRRLFEQARLTAAYQRYEESRHSRRLYGAWLDNQLEGVDVFTLNADFNLGFPQKSRLYYGAEATHNRVSSRAYSQHTGTAEIQPLAPRYGDQGNQTQSLAAYVNLHHPLSPGLSLNAGTRYTHYRLSSSFSQAFYPFPFGSIELRTGALNGHLGMAYARKKLRYDFLLSSGFRAPNVDDISKVFDPAPGTITVPNPDLKPEFSYNAESTMGWESRRFRSSITAYSSLLHQAVVRRPFLFNGQDSIPFMGERSAVVALVNTGRGLLAGASVNLRYQPFRHGLLSTSLTYGWGEDLETGERLRHIPPLFGQSSFSYQRSRWTALLQLRYNGSIAWQDLPFEEQAKGNIYAPDGTKSWFSIDLKGNFKPWPALELSSGIENLLDRHYRPYASGISAPGRNVYMSIRTFF